MEGARTTSGTTARVKRPARRHNDGRARRSRREGSEQRQRRGKDSSAECRPFPGGGKRLTQLSGHGPSVTATGASGQTLQPSDHTIEEKLNTKQRRTEPQLRGRGREEGPVKGWIRGLKALAATFFVAGYVLGVAYLIVRLLNERSQASIKGGKPAACARVICPLGTACVADGESGLPRCSSNTSQNLETMEAVLGVVLGVPAAVCLPCSMHWLLLRGCPRRQWWSADRAQRRRGQLGRRERQPAKPGPAPAAGAPDSEADEESGLGEGSPRPQPTRTAAGPRQRWWRLLQRPATAAARQAETAAAGQEEGVGLSDGEDDEMAEFFAPVRRNVEAPASDRGRVRDAQGASGPLKGAVNESGIEADATLDLLFGSWKAPKPVAVPSVTLAEDSDLVLDAMFSKAVRRPEASALEGSLATKDRGHDRAERPAAGGVAGGPSSTKLRGMRAQPGSSVPSASSIRREPGHAGAPASESEESQGLSALFAAGPTEGQGVRASRSTAPRPAVNTAPSTVTSGQDVGIGSKLSQEEDSEASGDLNFFSYALLLAKRCRAKGSGEEGADYGEDRQSNASGDSDSLADFEQAALADLFHLPVAAP